MKIQYKKENDTAIYKEFDVTSLYVGKCEHGYFINYNVKSDTQDKIVCPVELKSIKVCD